MNAQPPTELDEFVYRNPAPYSTRVCVPLMIKLEQKSGIQDTLAFNETSHRFGPPSFDPS